MSTSRDPEKFIPKLVDLLRKAKAKGVTTDTESDVNSSFEKIEEELQNMKDLPPRVKNWEQTLFNRMTHLERRLHKIVLGTESDIKGALDQITENIQQIKDSIPLVKQLMPSPERRSESSTRTSQPELGPAAQKTSQVWSKLECELGSSVAMFNTRRSYQHLESIELKLCFQSFSIFPQDSVIKKRPLIYWWIAERFITKTQDKTAEEVGEEIFQKLISHDLIQPHFNGSSTIVNNCTLHPWIRCLSISLAKAGFLFEFDKKWPMMPSNSLVGVGCTRLCITWDNPIPMIQASFDKVITTVFNVNHHYLSFRSEWLTRLKTLVVLQLGRWQNSVSHHIEVDDQGFLNGLGALTHLKYFSLRGISTITKLPSSILMLINLEILDLRACHNLETLPSDFSSLKKLTHLDISECYLLDIMPRGIEKLSRLQVLEGFVIGDLKLTPCRLGDFAKLQYLRRLSIHMGNEAVLQEGELNQLKNIVSLRRLKISWGVVAPKLREKIKDQSLEMSFPPDLEKLELQGLPFPDVPQWLKPSHLRKLKKLYIRGGELNSLAHDETENKWTVEILRLKYLNKLEIGCQQLLDQFPNLHYLDKINCHEIAKDIYDQNIVWSKTEGDISDKYINATTN